MRGIDSLLQTLHHMGLAFLINLFEINADAVIDGVFDYPAQVGVGGDAASCTNAQEVLPDVALVGTL